MALLSIAGAAAARGQTITVIDEHPRLVFRVDGTPGARTFATVQNLYKTNTAFRNEVQSYLTDKSSDAGPAAEAGRFVLTGDLKYATSALDRMATGSLAFVATQTAEPGVNWAVAYDWIANAWAGKTPPANLSTKLANIEGKLARFVSAALNNLDTNGPSLWHGRAALGSIAWTAALVLPTGNSTYDRYRGRAFTHWQDSLRAVHASGGWPEGPTYWASNRAITFPLAYQTYQTAVVSAPALAVSDPLADLRSLGLWQVYTQRGDGTFNRYGDVSSQVEISNGTIGRSIDYYAQVTNDPALAAFAESARAYRLPRPLYDRSYGWMYPIAFDPTQTKPAGYDPANPAASLGTALPHAMVFGQDAMGFVVARQGWNAGDTQVSFKAGDYLAHHGHADQGSFSIFKHTSLTGNSGGYGDYTGDNRLNYYVRTVSTNSILIQRPDEIWNPAGTAPPGGYVNDGGQRLVQATGSNVTSYQNWLDNKTSGKNYEQANITGFRNVDGEFTYVNSDLTRAYNSTLYDANGQGGKVSQVTRQTVYLQNLDALIVFDRVNSTDPSYKKKWLLHTPNKLAGGTETVAVGSTTDGILTVDGSTISGPMSMTSGAGKLFLQTLLPASYTVNKVGGPNYRYYVEDDGNDANGYNGTNHSGGYTDQPWQDSFDWRVEISPKTPQTFDTFLNVLSPRDSATASVTTGSILRNDPLVTIMRLGSQVIGFGTQGKIDQDFSYDIPLAGTYDNLLVDLIPNHPYHLNFGTGLIPLTSDANGTLDFTATLPSAGTVFVQVPEPVISTIVPLALLVLRRPRARAHHRGPRRQGQGRSGH